MCSRHSPPGSGSGHGKWVGLAGSLPGGPRHQYRPNAEVPAVSEPPGSLGTHQPDGPAGRQAEGPEAPHSGALKPQGLHGAPTWMSAFWVRILPAPSQASLGKPFSTRSPEDWGAAVIYLLSDSPLRPGSNGPAGGQELPGGSVGPEQDFRLPSTPPFLSGYGEMHRCSELLLLKEGRPVTLLVNSRVLCTHVYFYQDSEGTVSLRLGAGLECRRSPRR